MITTTIRSSIRVKPFLLRIRSPEPVDDGETLCRQHLQDGTFRGTATAVMAMSWPDSGIGITYGIYRVYGAPLKSLSMCHGCNLRMGLQSARGQKQAKKAAGGWRLSASC